MIKPKKAHSIANQNGEYHSNIVPSIRIRKDEYPKNTTTRFNQAHINIHLNQNGKLMLNNGCLSITQNNQMIAQIVVYHNKIQTLKYIFVSQKICGIAKNAIKPNTNPIVLANATLKPNLFLNFAIIV